MRALTALDTAGADYAGAVRHLADTLPEPPRRGQKVEWQGETYRLNRRAVADIELTRPGECNLETYRLKSPPPGSVIHADTGANCDHIFHCHIIEMGGKFMAFCEHRPYALDDGEGAMPCQEGHAPQLCAELGKGAKPVWCALCQETPEFILAIQSFDPELPCFAPDPEAWAWAREFLEVT